MSVLSVMFRQVGLLFIYMLIGYVLCRGKVLSSHGTKELSALLTNVLLPLAIIKPFLVEFETEKLKEFGISLLMALVAMGVTIVISALVFGKRRPVEHYSALFCNAGFMGIPLVQMVLGDDCVFFTTIYVGLIVIVQWTYGVWILTGSGSEITAKKIIKNPMILSAFIGIVMFFLPISLPDVARTAISSLSSMSGPVAMSICGIYLAQIRLKDVFAERSAYTVCLVRLVAIPFVTMILLSLFPDVYQDIRLAVLIPTATSVGANTPVFVEMFGKDHTQAVKIMCLNVIFSMITIPFLIGFAG